MNKCHKMKITCSLTGLSILLLFSTGCQLAGSKGYSPKTDTVIINNMQFQPAHLTIHPGDTVIWINQGIVAHNVTEDSLKSWTSGDIEPESTWKMVPQKNIRYFCTLHPSMKGTIHLAPKTVKSHE